MVIDSIACILGNMAHQEVNTLTVGPGAVQQAFKRMAALVGYVGHIQPFHNVPPEKPVCACVITSVAKDRKAPGGGKSRTREADDAAIFA